MFVTAYVRLFIIMLVISSHLLPDAEAAADLLQKSAPPSSHAERGGVFRRMLGDDPATLDPAVLTDIYGRAIVSQVFDGLVQFDAHLTPIPALADLWEASRDSRTWTFYLRRGATFHHGREITADDFIYSFTRLLQVQNPGPVGEFFKHIRGAQEFMQGTASTVEGLQAPDRYTLRLILQEPYAPPLVLQKLVNAAVVPREKVEELGEKFGRAPVGSGPFKFVRWEAGREIVLEANDDYFEGRPFLDGVVFKIFSGAKLEESFGEFLKGNLEETIIPGARTEEVHADPKYQAYQHVRKPTLSLLYIGFNTQLKPFHDRRVRQAFSYAVNTEAIVRKITKMGSLPASGVLPPGMLGYTPDLKGYGYDPDQAKRLLAEAGYPNGAGLPVVHLWSVHQAQTTRAELAAYQEYLAKIGATVEVHFAPDWSTYKQMLVQGRLPMFRLVRIADLPDPDNFLAPMLHSASATNYTFYRNPSVDHLLEQARREFHDVQRITLYRELEHRVMSDAPLIAQHHSSLEYLYQPYVQGVEVSLIGKRVMPLKKISFKKGVAATPTGAGTHVQPSP
jgi:peptide/nickel transport system substrate-binding protein/oligopeptide transport system substrate-binding protein